MNELSLNGFLVRKLRIEAGLSQLQLSYETNVDSAVICRVESGKVKNPSFLSVANLATYFNVSMDSLYTFGKVQEKMVIYPDKFNRPEDLLSCFRSVFCSKFNQDFMYPQKVSKKKWTSNNTSNQLCFEF